MQTAHLTGRPCAAVLRTSRSSSSAQMRPRRQLVVQAVLDTSAAFAVAQQSLVFAVAVGAEAAVTGLSTPSDVKGRPSSISTLVGMGALLAGGVLTRQLDAGAVGCTVGLAASTFMLIVYAFRIKDTPFNPEEWPGAKATPAVMALLAFFAWQANFQGLRNVLGQLN